MNSGFNSFGTGSSFSTPNANLFGSTQNTNQGILRPTGTGTLFGSTTNQSTLGTPGSTQQTGLFSGGFGGFQSGTQTQQTSGTTCKFVAPPGQDTLSKGGTQIQTNTNHQCITAMKEYESKSLEELRFEDYQANRKFAQQQQTSQFGSTGGLFSSTNTGGGFGTSLFGSSTQPTAKTGLFGSTTTTTTAAPQTGSLFGASQPTANRPFFGASTTSTTAPSTGFSGFGTQPTTTSVFGSTTTAQPSTNIFGNIGQTSTAPSGGLFGSTNTTTGATSGGLFSQANKQFSTFGQPSLTSTQSQPTQASPFNFSSGTTTTGATTTGTSLFGTQTTTQQKPFGSGGFGTLGTTSTGFGTTPAATTTTTGGIFGSITPQQTANQQKLTFGSTTGTFGGFGTPSTGVGNTGSTGIFGGFGSTTGTSTQPTTTTSPFGSGLNTSGIGGSTFGSGTTGGGLFGATTSTTQPSTTGTTGGLFGSQTSTGFGTSGLTSGFGTGTANQSLLGGSNLANTSGTSGISGGLFGTSNQQTSQFNLGGGLTGGSTLGSGTTGGFGGFGGLTSGGQTSTFGSGLNVSGGGLGLQQPQQQLQLQQLQQSQTQEQPLVQQQLMALSNSPYGSSHLLRSTIQDLSKKDDILKPISPIAQQPYITEATSPVKITSLVSSGIGEIKGGLSQSIKITPKPLNQISLNKNADLFEGLEDEQVPCFYPRKNIKKLLFKPSSSSSSIVGAETSATRRSSASSSVNGDNKDFMGKGNFNDERFNQNAPYASSYAPNHITTDLNNLSDDGGGDNQSEISNGNQPVTNHPANIILERPGYFTIPPMQDLASMTDSKGDCFVDNFAIGRVDYGCITFPGTTNVANMNLDEIIHIRRKEVHVYPDETKKPLVGQGLNKSAEITLHRIWPTDKQTKKPITDANSVINMGFNKKIEKATIEMGAQFIDYDPTTGSWTFKVKHFSKYGFHDSDDEEDDKLTSFANNSININTQLKQTGASVITMINNLDKEEAGTDMIKKEKDMIQKQLKLIETRRLELMQNRKGSIGSNLNSITNQQWELINEYTIPTVSNQINNAQNRVGYVDNSNLHLELSSDSQENGIDDDEDDIHSLNSNDQHHKKNLRKALILDNDNETDDNEGIDSEENKENSNLYPNLKELKKVKTKSKTKKSIKTDKIYPNLNNFDTANDNYKFSVDTYQKDQQNLNIHIDSDEKEYSKLGNNEMNDDQFKSEEFPFMVSYTNGGRLLNNVRSNRGLIQAFFNDEQETDEYISMVEDGTKMKMNSLIQKPQTAGLLKRGLGGISNAELFDNKIASFKQEPSLPQTKVSKMTAMSLSMTDVQQRIGIRMLKPKLWNRFLYQKSIKLGLTNLKDQQSLTGEADDKIGGKIEAATSTKLQSLKISESAAKLDSEQQVSFIPYIELKNSLINNRHDYVADAALFHSRQFKVGWSLNPTSSTYTKLNFNLKKTDANVVQLLTPVMFSNFPNFISTINPDTETLFKLEKIRETCEKYLEIQLDLTDFVEENLNSTNKQLSNLINSNKFKLPLLRPKPGNDLIRRCCECTQEIEDNLVGHPDIENIKNIKSVWNLCHNLWGDIPDNYKIDPYETELSSYETEQIRKRLLGEWLAEVSTHRIDRECQFKFNKNKESYLDSLFSLLTGKRLLDACKLAAENDDYRLALLLAQSTGGNETVREMIKKQINGWLTSGTDKYLNKDRLKFYVLLSGNLTLPLSNLNSVLNVCENLDWKRQFALHLWYKCLPIHSIHDALNAFENNIAEDICKKPLPPYLEDRVPTLLELDSNTSINASKFKPPATSLNNSVLFQQFIQQSSQLSRVKSVDIYDTCFHLIKLYCDNKYSIADTIAPLSYTSNQLDFRLSWHLAMALLSLNYKYISRECLETLHDSYAAQLQSIGLWHWSIFILMHIIDDKRREACVKTYLSRHVTSDSELSKKETFLIEKLKVPAEWIYEYKALRAKYDYSHENQFKLLIKAHKWNEAHSVLIEMLAPDLLIKQNLKTLNEYLISLSKEYQSINKWNLGGQIYLDYIKLIQNSAILFDFSSDDTVLEKLLNDEIIKEIHDLIINLSTRIKELKDLDFSSSSKLLVCVNISKILHRFFIILSDLNRKDNYNQIDVEQNTDEELEKDNTKILSKSTIEKAYKLTESVPDHDIIQAMLMKKNKYTYDSIMPRRIY